MKNFNFCLVVLANLFLSVSLFSQSIAITDDDTYTANPSAMLDVKSLTKGILVPRLTTVQRNAVSNPATGLLVFDTDAGSFYFYNGTIWVNLTSDNGILSYTSPDKVYVSDITDKFGVGTISPIGKMEVKSDVSIGNENPIFNVVNSTGDTVFAVYEQGVRINVYDDPITKASGSKGGFAVGGFSPAKGTTTNEYLRITPDSIRLYVEDVPAAKASGSKGGFAVGGFSPAKAGGFTNEYLRVTSDSTRIYTGDTIKGFGVQNINSNSKTSYLQLTPKNYFIGHSAGKSITTGMYNSFIGYQSGYSDTSGSSNVANGYLTLYSNTSGNSNTAIGTRVLYLNTTGYNNTGCGTGALKSNTTGYVNTAVGCGALQNNTTGYYNTSIGYNALPFNTIGSRNTATGLHALFTNTTGENNTATGNYAMNYNEVGSYNTAMGSGAVMGTKGSFNTGMGANALLYNDGDNNTALGFNAFAVSANLTNSMGLGANTAVTASNQVRIGDANVTDIGGFADWTNVSDKRFKNDIKTSNLGLDFILKLRPVTYYMNMEAIAEFLQTPDSLRLKDAEKIKESMLQTGFIAQDVEKAAQELGYDFSGVDKPKNEKDYYGLRYAEFTVPLVKAVQELNAKNEELTKENEVMKIKIQELENLKAENLQMKEDIEKIMTLLNSSAKK